MSEAVERFKTALADIPEVQNRLTAGQQFNAYDLARSKPYTKTVGIGPVFNLLSLADTMAPEAAELIEAALRLSVASLTGEGEPVAWRAKLGEYSNWTLCNADPSDEHGWHSVQPLYTRPVACSDREAVIACIRDAADRAFEAGRQGDIHFRFGDIIARADALLSGGGE